MSSKPSSASCEQPKHGCSMCLALLGSNLRFKQSNNFRSCTAPIRDSSYMASNEKMQKHVQGFCASGFITFSNLSVQGRRKRCGGSRDLASTWDGNRMNHAICHELTGFSGLYDVTSKDRALLSICGVGLEWSQKDQVDSGHGHVDVPFDHG